MSGKRFSHESEAQGGSRQTSRAGGWGKGPRPAARHRFLGFRAWREGIPALGAWPPTEREAQGGSRQIIAAVRRTAATTLPRRAVVAGYEPVAVLHRLITCNYRVGVLCAKHKAGADKQSRESGHRFLGFRAWRAVVQTAGHDRQLNA